MPADDKVNILLVDDQPGNLLALEAILADLGQNLVRARSGTDALRALLHQEFAVILMDVRMPGMDGLEAAALIRQRDKTRHVPIIFLTAHESADVQVFKGYSLGAVDFLTKPLVPEVLRSKVSVFVELFRMTRQVRRQAEMLHANQQREHERRLTQEKQRWEVERLRAEAAREKQAAEDLARAEQKTRERARQQARVAALGQRALAGVDIPALLDEAVALAAETLDADYGLVLELTGDGRALLPRAGVGWHKGVPPHGPAPVPVEGGPGALLAEEPLVVEDLPADERFRDVALLQEHGVTGGASVVIRGNGRPFGVLGAYTARGRPFSVEDAHFLQALANVLAAAIQRRAHEEELARLKDRLAAQLDEVQESNRGKDEFLAMLAHELRNPLAPILTALHVMRQGSEPGVQEQARDMVDRQTRHMSRLIDDLLDVSRITQGKIRLRKEPIELGWVIGRAVDSTRPLIEERRHTLEVDLAPEPVRLEADPTRLEQVLSNLLNNAAKYTEPGGRIGLTAGRENGEAVIRVRDTGIGIAPALLPRVFELFMQAHPTLGGPQGGLGIGLTLVRRLVELHEGRVEVHSEGVGRGSEFVVRLPVLDGPTPGPRPEEAPQVLPARRPRRVLVVDDNRDAAESLALMLGLDRHEVRVAHDGPQALEAARAWTPEVVLLDIGLPGMSGYEVGRQLLEQSGGRVELVAMTGYGQEEDRRRSREAGFAHHLVKPVDPQVLRGLLA